MKWECNIQQKEVSLLYVTIPLQIQILHEIASYFQSCQTTLAFQMGFNPCDAEFAIAQSTILQKYSIIIETLLYPMSTNVPVIFKHFYNNFDFSKSADSSERFRFLSCSHTFICEICVL